MRLKVLSTGSTANMYLLETDNGALLLDAGLAYKQALPSLGNLRSIRACLVTHMHSDHSRCVQELSRHGVKVFMSEGEKKALKADTAFVRTCKDSEMFDVGPFTVVPFNVEHDTPEPLGFYIRYNPTGETVLYATDTYYLKYTFPNVNYWLIECNHCEDIADKQMLDGDLNGTLRERLRVSHMSLETLTDIMRANNLTDTRKIILVHLSRDRSDEDRMIETIHEITHKDVDAARNGETHELSLTPF